MFAGRRCLIVGGGDSALDWTINLQDTAAPARSTWPTGATASAGSRRRCRTCASCATRRGATIHTPFELRELRGGDHLESVLLEDTTDKSLHEVELDEVILQLGFVSRLGHIADWGLEVVGKKQVRVEPDDVRDGPAERLRRRRRGLLRRQDHADHRRARRGGDRRQPVRGPGARREGAARLLDGVSLSGSAREAERVHGEVLAGEGRRDEQRRA